VLGQKVASLLLTADKLQASLSHEESAAKKFQQKIN